MKGIVQIDEKGLYFMESHKIFTWYLNEPYLIDMWNASVPFPRLRFYVKLHVQGMIDMPIHFLKGK